MRDSFHRLHRMTLTAIGLTLALAGCQTHVGDSAPDQSSREDFRRVEDRIDGQYIVVLSEDRTQSLVSVAQRAQALATTYAGSVVAELEGGLDGFVAEMAEEDAVAMSADPAVAWVEEDAVATIGATQTGVGFGLDRIDQRLLPLDGTYTFRRTGAGVHVYVIDSGIRTAHASFNGRIGRGGFAIQDGRGVEDCNGHGTHVAGIIGSDRFGVAKGVTLHPVRVFDCTGSGRNSDVISGINFVVQNVERPAVINMSLGGAASDAVDQAVRSAVAAGITVVVSAGNDARDACLQSPARVAQALTVASTDPNDARSSFSNFGTCVDLFAPGRSIISAGIASSTATATLSGTSQAAPHVAGAAALFLETVPSASPSLVGQIVVGATTPAILSDVRGSPNKLLNTGFAN